MSNVNLLLAADQHVVDEIYTAQNEADSALEQFVAAKRRISELEALRDLRNAMGGTVAGVTEATPLRREVA